MVYYNSIKDVSDTFFEYGSPFWKLYTGKGRASFPTGATANNNLLYEQKADTEIGDSWRILESKLSRFGRGGYAHLYLGDKDNFISVPIFFAHSGQDGENGAGISGFGPAGLPYPVLTAIEKERTIWNLERRVEELAQGQEAKIGFLEKIADRVLESEQLPVILNGLMGLLGRFAAATPTIGLPSVNTANIAQRAQDRPQIDKTAAISNFVNRVGGEFQDESEFADYLQKVTELFEFDPDGMKQIVKQVHAQTQTGNE